ncbi:hypothetical protein [Ralstonia solanacearum]|uniref:hypothetical protein n=1 Tax=Ralstonia solanacearum TaxID=305 RepID=UPI000AAE1DBF|nr:hypothetical protein [Ralstonia solanacearum]QOK80938.1 hypothetical protein HF906_01340 [Ralstonia solanacearum]
MRAISVGLLTCLMSGCAAFFPPAQKQDLPNGGYWLNYDTARRGAVILPKGDNYKYCAEQSPDVAVSLVNKVQADVKAQGVDIGSGQFESAAEVVALAGRTKTVLLARESLYRLCELSINNDLDAKTVNEMLKNITDMIGRIAQSDSDQANARQAVAKTASSALSQNLDPTQVQHLLERIK